MPNFIDKTGKTYGQLTVISRAENKGKSVYWNCVCSCGKHCCVRGDRLTESHVDDRGNPSCGHLRMLHILETTSKDLTNQIFGRLTVLEKTDERTNNGSIIWKCKCSCGNITKVSSENLTKKDHPTKSCGCLQRERASEWSINQSKNNLPKIGDNIFDFVVEDIKLEPTNAGHNESWIYAKCPFCDNKRWFQTRYIKSGDTKSCGCIGKSSGEEKIEKILKENNISFIREYIFNDCKDILPLRFDFYVNNKYIIEFDGIQHSSIQKFGNITEEQAEEKFIKTQKHDTMKNEYCYNNNIPIIRIPYTNYNNLCLKDLIPETSDFLL